MKPAREDDGTANSATTELNRLFEEALRCLKGTDLRGANAALKKAHAKVASTSGVGAGGGRETVTKFEDRG